MHILSLYKKYKKKMSRSNSDYRGNFKERSIRSIGSSPDLMCVYIGYTVACESLGTPCRICENVNNFNKIREIIQNACYFLFSTVLSKTFYIKYVYI